jgi:hypothetical protein
VNSLHSKINDLVDYCTYVINAQLSTNPSPTSKNLKLLFRPYNKSSNLNSSIYVCKFSMTYHYFDKALIKLVSILEFSIISQKWREYISKCERLKKDIQPLKS